MRIRKKTAVLIPAGGLDETAFNPIMPYLEEYRVIIPVLDGSVISEKSDMPDRKTEVSKITAGLKEHGTERIALLLGISYGATIALEVLMTRKFQVSRAVLDGGIRREDNLLVMYGDKDGYKGGIKWFEKHHCPFEKTILKGYGHCEHLYQNPERS